MCKHRASTRFRPVKSKSKHWSLRLFSKACFFQYLPMQTSILKPLLWGHDGCSWSCCSTFHFLPRVALPCCVCLGKSFVSARNILHYQKIWREPPSVQPYPLVLLLLVDTVSPPLFRAYWSGWSGSTKFHVEWRHWQMALVFLASSSFLLHQDIYSISEIKADW